MKRIMVSKGNEVMKRGLYVGLVSAACLSVSQLAMAQTPLFEAMEVMDQSKRGFDLERSQQCLLGAKVVEAASEFGLIEAGSTKHERAVTTGPKLERILKNRTQTQVIFDQKIGEIKSEYNIFKTAEKKERKRLYKIARGTNKVCGRPLARLNSTTISRTNERAALIKGVDSNTARLCYAVAGQGSNTSLLDILSSVVQRSTWSSVYMQAKRREGVPSTELIEPLKIDDEKTRLKEVGTDRALQLFEDCDKKYKRAEFEYKLTAPEAPKAGEEKPPLESIVDWN